MIATGPIGRDPAQRLARQELSRAVYHQTSIRRVIEEHVLAFLGSVFANASRVTPGGWWTLVALASLAVLACAVIAVRLGPLARSARRTAALHEPGARPLTAAQLRDDAEASAAAGDYGTAVLQRLRAIAAGCEERGILAPQAGRTADELARQAGLAFPDHAGGLAAAARLFDRVRYGGGTGTRDGYELLHDLDLTLARLAARPAAGAGPAGYATVADDGMTKTTDTISRWRWPAVAALAVIAAGAVIALLQPPPATAVLDPNGTGSAGGRALADLLTARGQHVFRTEVPGGAAAASRAVELVTSPGLLSQAQLALAGKFPGDILLVGPDQRALRALAPAVRIAGADSIQVVKPACALRQAAISGDVYLGGAALRTANQAARRCYPGSSGYGLIRYADGTRTISVLGASAPLTNGYLGERGDAALAMNLLANATEIVWLVPSPGNAPPPRGSGTGNGNGSGASSFFGLVPWPVYLIAIQLAIAVLLAAAWRARRLGPLVAERLPVIVQAAETVEGHGRLYQSLRARDGAAAKLRAAARSGIARVTDAGTAARPDAIAARTGQSPAEVAGLLDGPPPKTDEALVTLATELDTLMRKIRQS